mmetsp:Transcript_79868/g.229262  ORF Transcript_79868/g.229262 Transcript_79868/m.229262 type:complete len:251 (+) Transcript_79868:1543-2295(+)
MVRQSTRLRALFNGSGTARLTTMEAKADSNDTVLPLSTCSSLVAASGVGSKACRILTSRNLASTSTRGSGNRRSKSRTPLRTRASRFATTSRLTSPAAPPSPLGEDMEEVAPAKARATSVRARKQAQRASCETSTRNLWMRPNSSSSTSSSSSSSPSSGISRLPSRAAVVVCTSDAKPPVSRMHLWQVALPARFVRHCSKSRATLPPVPRSSSARSAKTVSARPCIVTICWISLFEAVSSSNRPKLSLRT